MTIRQLLPEDYSLLNELRCVFGRALEEPDFLRVAYSPLDFDRLLQNDRVVIWVAHTEESEVVGGLQAYRLPSLVAPGEDLYLYNLAVAAPNRRQGIGSALIQTAVDYAHEHHFLSVFVQVHAEDEDAHRLYGKYAVRVDPNVTQYEFLD